MKKPKSFRKLIKELDRVFSLYIRKRDKRCFTCGKRDHLQNGHYISRSNMTLRWDEINNNAQCVRDNVFLNGNYPVYALKLIEKYGEGILEELDRRSKVITKYSKSDLQTLINRYQKLI